MKTTNRFYYGSWFLLMSLLLLAILVKPYPESPIEKTITIYKTNVITKYRLDNFHKNNEYYLFFTAVDSNTIELNVRSEYYGEDWTITNSMIMMMKGKFYMGDVSNKYINIK